MLSGCCRCSSCCWRGCSLSLLRADERADLLPDQVQQNMTLTPLQVRNLSKDATVARQVFYQGRFARYITGCCVVVDGGVLVQQRSAPVDVYPVSRFPEVPAV